MINYITNNKMKSEIQSVLINKKYYSFHEALKKLLEMGFKYKSRHN